MRKEDKLATQISDYLSMQYPKIIYHFDLSSGGKMSIGMAVRNKRLNKITSYPDLFIAKPAGQYSGLFIELKAESIFNKNGSIKKSKHLDEQRMMLNRLMNEGYRCVFGCGFEATKNIIDEYFKGAS